eukprot:1491680-Amphidinium_carterae.1
MEKKDVLTRTVGLLNNSSDSTTQTDSSQTYRSVGSTGLRSNGAAGTYDAINVHPRAQVSFQHGSTGVSCSRV